MNLTAKYKTAFCAELRWNWPECHPLPYDHERDPVAFILPGCLPSVTMAKAAAIEEMARDGPTGPLVVEPYSGARP